MKALQLVKSATNVILVALGCVWCVERAWHGLQAAGRKAAPPNEPRLRLLLAEAHAVGAAIVMYAEMHGGRMPTTLGDLQPRYLGTLVDASNYSLSHPGQVYPPDGIEFGVVAQDLRGYWKGDRKADIVICGAGEVYVRGD